MESLRCIWRRRRGLWFWINRFLNAARSASTISSASFFQWLFAFHLNSISAFEGLWIMFLLQFLECTANNPQYDLANSTLTKKLLRSLWRLCQYLWLRSHLKACTAGELATWIKFALLQISSRGQHQEFLRATSFLVYYQPLSQSTWFSELQKIQWENWNLRYLRPPHTRIDEAANQHGNDLRT